MLYGSVSHTGWTSKFGIGNTLLSETSACPQGFVQSHFTMPQSATMHCMQSV